MAEHRSEKSPYQSRFGGGWLSAGQWLAELMCERQARKKKTGLPAKFWGKDPWKREFLLQVRHANAILKLYSPAALSRALKTPNGKTIHSLGAPFLDPLVAEEQRKLDRDAALRSERPSIPAPATGGEQPRPAFVNKKSPLSKLRDLDGQEKRDG